MSRLTLNQSDLLIAPIGYSHPKDPLSTVSSLAHSGAENRARELAVAVIRACEPLVKDGREDAYLDATNTWYMAAWPSGVG